MCLSNFLLYAKFARMFFIKFLTVIVHTSFPKLMPWFLLWENNSKEKRTSESLFSKIIAQLFSNKVGNGKREKVYYYFNIQSLTRSGSHNQASPLRPSSLWKLFFNKIIHWQQKCFASRIKEHSILHPILEF